MKRLALLLTLAFGLSGCAALSQITAVFEEVRGASVSPQQVYIAVNAFDAAKATATQYFIYCRPRLAEAVCSAVNRRVVIKYVKAGTAARDQLETYLVAGTPAPSQIFNTLRATIASLQASAAGASR